MKSYKPFFKDMEDFERDLQKMDSAIEKVKNMNNSTECKRCGAIKNKIKCDYCE